MNNKKEAKEFEAIVRDYHQMVFRTLLGFVHLKEDAEDLTQEVFIRAFSSWNKFRGDAEVSTWLYRISVNLALSYIKVKNRKSLLQLSEEAFALLFNRSNGDKNPEQVLEQQERDKKMADAIDGLPEKQRTAFVLSRYDELSQKEVATIMQISEGAVEQLLIRAKTNLQKKLRLAIGKENN